MIMSTSEKRLEKKNMLPYLKWPGEHQSHHPFPNCDTPPNRSRQQLNIPFVVIHHKKLDTLEKSRERITFAHSPIVQRVLNTSATPTAGKRKLLARDQSFKKPNDRGRYTNGNGIAEGR